MNDELALFLDQREVLLASDDASLALLRQHDRRLLSRMEKGRYDTGLTRRNADDLALVDALQNDIGRVAVILEARERLWPGELGRVQAQLVSAPATASAAWWLAAHYPELEFPPDFPEHGPDQFRAAGALSRRGRGDLLPEPWRGWADLLGGKGDAMAVAQALWAETGGTAWEFWLGPVLALIDRDAGGNLVNWLSGRVEDQQLIVAMGLCCNGGFLPWLASMRHDSALASAALREIRWLSGDQNLRHDGRQCWGRPLDQDQWRRLFQTLPLGFRPRLWHLCAGSIRGAASSLQGAIWRAGE